METKPRILYLQKILLERTDEENPLTYDDQSRAECERTVQTDDCNSR